MRPRFFGGPIQHGVDEFMPVSRAELLGELHGFGKCHAVRQLRTRFQLVQAQPQDGVFYGIELMGRYLAQAGQAAVQSLAIGRDALDQLAKVFAIDPLRLRIRGKLQLHILPGERIYLNLVKGLQRKTAGETPSSVTYFG